MKVNAYKCPCCKDIVYSRALHDFRRCTCCNMFVDGGFDYTRLGFSYAKPQPISYDVNITKQKLFKDYNENINKYGLIKGEL